MNDKQTSVFFDGREVLQDYGLRAKELKKEGKKLIGYICSLVPLEIITAAGCIPFRGEGRYTRAHYQGGYTA